MRINKYLAECGVASRRNADELVKSGRVMVNGKKMTEPGYMVSPDNDTIFVDGKKVRLVATYTYIMLNKPKGCISTSKDELGRKTVFDYLKDVDKKLSTVGRLDYDSEGLLLFTNDGSLINKLTHPSYQVSKTYIVKINNDITESELATLRKGVVLDDGDKTSRAKVKLLSHINGVSRLEVTIFEGKNRQIRRMFESIGKEVIFLKRKAIAELQLGGLARGTYRHLSDKEVSYLKYKA